MFLKNWAVVRTGSPYDAPEVRSIHLFGEVHGNPKFEEGALIATSRITGVEETSCPLLLRVHTVNSCYEVNAHAISDDYKDFCPDGFEQLASLIV